MNDPTNWNVDPSIKIIEGIDSKLGKEMEKRWNAYPGLVGLLRQCLPIVDRSIQLSVNVYPAQIALLMQIKQAIDEGEKK